MRKQPAVRFVQPDSKVRRAIRKWWPQPHEGGRPERPKAITPKGWPRALVFVFQHFPQEAPALCEQVGRLRPLAVADTKAPPDERE